MKHLRYMALPLLLAVATSAMADDDERRYRGHSFKQEYWSGNCKVKRKMDSDGEFEEKVKCRSPRQVHYAPAPVYVIHPQPAPVYVVQSPPPPAVVIGPTGVVVHGSVRIGW